MADAVQALLDAAAAGRLRRARDAGRAADAGRAGSGCRGCRGRAGCWSSASTRAKAITSSSTRSPAATCTSGLAQLLAWRLARTQPNTFSLSDQRLRPRDRWRRSRSIRRRCSTAALFGTRDAAGRRAGQPELAASWRSGAFARSRAWPAWSSAATPARRRACSQLQASSQPVLRGLSQVRRRQPAARPGRARGAVAGARTRAPAQHPGASGRAAARPGRRWPRPARSPAADGRAPARAAVAPRSWPTGWQRILANAEAVLDGTEVAVQPARRSPGRKRQSV